ncbi:MAG: hypothetical protein IPF93_20475 [Saprospiraceae bacterium]|nr:hypothetical protein [Saprospiraceae bacterium]
MVLPPFISVSAAWYETNDKPGNTTLAIRFSTNGSAWDSWTDFKLYDHFEKGRFTETATQMYIDKNTPIINYKSTATFFTKGSIYMPY